MSDENIVQKIYSIIGSDNGLSPGRRQAIIWTNAGLTPLHSTRARNIDLKGEAALALPE